MKCFKKRQKSDEHDEKTAKTIEFEEQKEHDAGTRQARLCLIVVPLLLTAWVIIDDFFDDYLDDETWELKLKEWHEANNLTYVPTNTTNADAAKSSKPPSRGPPNRMDVSTLMLGMNDLEMLTNPALKKAAKDNSEKKDKHKANKLSRAEKENNKKKDSRRGLREYSGDPSKKQRLR